MKTLNKKGDKICNIRKVSIKAFGKLKELGPVIDLTYEFWEDGNYYIHRFKRSSQPLLVYDEKKQLFIIDGNYTIDDDHGIIDL